MARLTTKTRNALPSKSFAGPDRSYPIENASHARNALARVSEYGSPAVKAEVRSKVAKKYPGMGHPHKNLGKYLHKKKGARYSAANVVSRKDMA